MEFEAEVDIPIHQLSGKIQYKYVKLSGPGPEDWNYEHVFGKASYQQVRNRVLVVPKEWHCKKGNVHFTSFLFVRTLCMKVYFEEFKIDDLFLEY